MADDDKTPMINVGALNEGSKIFAPDIGVIPANKLAEALEFLCMQKGMQIAKADPKNISFNGAFGSQKNSDDFSRGC